MANMRCELCESSCKEKLVCKVFVRFKKWLKPPFEYCSTFHMHDSLNKNDFKRLLSHGCSFEVHNFELRFKLSPLIYLLIESIFEPSDF